MSGRQSDYPLEVRLFGTWEAWVHGQPLPPLRSRKERWLLALLTLYHDRETARDWIAATFWPDNEESQALLYLRRGLSNLRQALGSEAHRLLSPTSRTVQFDLTDAYSDVLTFDTALGGGQRSGVRGTNEEPALSSLREAVALYRGPLLPDCDEEWVVTERSRYEHSYLNALERLAAIAQEQGELVEAVGWLRRLVSADPYRESAVCALIQALSDSGDRAAMQQVYQELRRRLRNDLNVSPAPETEALYQRLSQREAQAATPFAVSAPAPPSLRHLPVPLTDLIGREQEITEVTGWLQRCRLVTLVGPGGVGKTRLAIAAAEEALPQFAAGVWFVDLAPLQDASRVAEATARALAVPEQPGRSPEERLEEAIASRALLLVLDNCEHVQEVSAVLAYRLLSACPGLRILTTSRHLLGVTGEQVYSVPSLALPPEAESETPAGLATAEKDPASLLEYEGIRLFAQRAMQVNPSFRLDRRNAALVTEICRRLDGIPLAIEMAAARLRSLSVGDIHARLSDRFRLLTTGNRAALPRQQTLRAALDWSYDLLSEKERTLLNRLAVFVGGFTSAGARAVREEEEEEPCLDHLASLIDKSLLMVDSTLDPPRYQMLETVREYGLEQLDAEGKRAETRQLHWNYCLHLAETAIAQWGVSKEKTWLAQLDREYDNLRAALSYGWEAPERVTLYALLWAMLPYWYNYGFLSDGRRYLEAFLKLPVVQTPSLERARALLESGWMALEQNDSGMALIYAKEAAQQYQQLGEWNQYASALACVAEAHKDLWDIKQSKPYYEEAIAVWRRVGNHVYAARTLLVISEREHARRYAEEYLQAAREANDTKEIVGALHSLSWVEFRAGNFTAAQMFAEEALQISQNLSDRHSELVELQHLGLIHLMQRNYDTAKESMLASLHIQKTHERKQDLLTAMQALADIAMQEQQWKYALVLYSITETMLEKYKLISAEGRAIDTETQLAKLQTNLDPETFDRLWKQGQSLTTTQAIAYALAQE